MIKLRLIGGPWDGEVTQLEFPMPILQMEETEFGSEGFKVKGIHNYIIKGISGPEVMFYVGIHASLSLKEGMEKIFYETDEDRAVRRRVPGQENYRDSR